MSRKPARRKVHYFTSGFSDGAVISAGPDRKPSAKALKERGLRVDSDGVFCETRYGPSEWHLWDDQQRVKVVTVLANRLNTRRAIRELVLPELASIQKTLANIQRRLDKIDV